MSEKDIIWSSGVYSQSTIDIKKVLNVIKIHGGARKFSRGRRKNVSSSPVQSPRPPASIAPVIS